MITDRLLGVQIRGSHADSTTMVQAQSSTNIKAGMILVERVTLTAVLALALLSMALGWNHLSAPSAPHNHPNCPISATC
jgi:hypothetical protein